MGTMSDLEARELAYRYFLDHSHDEVESLADAVYADFRKWKQEGWSAGDAYCAIEDWLASRLENVSEEVA